MPRMSISVSALYHENLTYLLNLIVSVVSETIFHPFSYLCKRDQNVVYHTQRYRSMWKEPLTDYSSTFCVDFPESDIFYCSQCTVFLSFVFNVTAVLDRNPYIGKEFLPLTLKLMWQCVGDEKSDGENAMTLDGLDPAMQHVWLMNLLVILYKVGLTGLFLMGIKLAITR